MMLWNRNSSVASLVMILRPIPHPNALLPVALARAAWKWPVPSTKEHDLLIEPLLSGGTWQVRIMPANLGLSPQHCTADRDKDEWTQVVLSCRIWVPSIESAG